MRFVKTTLVAMIAAASAAPALANGKLNAVYVNTAPHPIGDLTQSDVDGLANSKFNHFLFSFVNYCTPNPASQQPADPTPGDNYNESTTYTCPGNAPEVVWNLRPAYNDDGTPVASVQKAMASLAASGKGMYLSLGGYDNPETWNAFADGTDAEVAGFAKALQDFMTTYSITGVDFDIEPSNLNPVQPNPKGFGAVVGALAALDSVPPMSTAPYSTSTGIDVTNTGSITSAQWQYCQMHMLGVVPSSVNRQYYAGGASGFDPRSPNSVSGAVAADTGTFTCDGAQLNIDITLMNPGISPTESGQVNSFASSCDQGSSAPYYSNCAAVVSQIVADHPTISGMADWAFTFLDHPFAWASEMDAALNQ